MSDSDRCAVVGTILGLIGLCTPVCAQAIWTGQDGNWTDSRWSGGTGPGDQPGKDQDILLPAATGQVTVDTDLTRDVGPLGDLTQESGSLIIAPTGDMTLSGDVRMGVGVDGAGRWIVSGRLNVAGHMDIGLGRGDSFGNAVGIFEIEGAAEIDIGGNVDTWWDDGAQMSITGDDASIQIGGRFVLGTDATLTVNLDSDQFSTTRAVTGVSFEGGDGMLNVHFVEGYEPAIGASWTLFDSPQIRGEIPNVSVPAMPKGSQLLINYDDGGLHGQVVTLDYINTLNLRIDSETGQARIENPVAGGATLDIDGYIVRSNSNSLSASGFNGLGRDGWLPGLEPSQSDGLLSETSFDGSLAVQSGDLWEIGTVFKTGATTDLTFEYRLTNGETMSGTVEYLAGSIVVGDFNGNRILDAGDINDLTVQSAIESHPSQYDLNRDARVDSDDVNVWITDLFKSWVGDANLDREFDSSDLVAILATGLYESDIFAVWTTGDFNGDGRFDSGDMVTALQDGGYEQGPKSAVKQVPEPSNILPALVILSRGILRRRKNSAR